MFPVFIHFSDVGVEPSLHPRRRLFCESLLAYHQFDLFKASRRSEMSSRGAGASSFSRFLRDGDEVLTSDVEAEDGGDPRESVGDISAGLPIAI
jgi:hypothetical protein